MSEFELQPDTPDSTVSSGALARAHSVSAQTIANYRKQGMPYASVDGRGHYRYNPDDCAAWINANTGAKQHGGPREGAGRKPARTTAKKTARPTTKAVPPPNADPGFAVRVEAGRIKQQAYERRAGAIHVADLLNLTYEELLVLCEVDVEVSGLSKASLERLKLIQETRAKDRQEREKLGELVEAEAVRAEYGRAVAALREAMEQLPQRLLRSVMSAAEADPEREHEVLDAMTSEIDRLIARIEASVGADTARAA